MSSDPSLFLEAGVRRGLFSRAQANRSLASPDPRGWLVEKKLVSPDEARDLEAAAGQIAAARTLAKQGILGGNDAERLIDALASGRHATVEDAAAELAIEMNAPMPKSLGPYEVVRRLGFGGMGVVYAARDTRLGRDVAVKVMKGLFDEDDVRRFWREQHALARLKHPGIVSIFDVGEENGLPYFVMELVEGANLLEAGLDLRAAVDAVRQAAEAVEFAHRRGVLHRDLKPANLLVQGTRALVLDFGLAKLQEEKDRSVSVQGLALGTPAYMSPEQARGSLRDVDARTDVWGLGATLYHMLTGSAPFEGGSVPQILQKVLTQDPVLPRVVNPSVPGDLETICLRALEKDPRRRYASAGEFGADLGRWLAGEPVLAKPPTVAYRVRRWFLRKRVLVAASAFVALAAIGAGAGVTWWGKYRAFQRRRADAVDAYRAGDWRRAALESERAIEFRRDPELLAIEKESRARVEAEETGERFRRMTGPIELLLREVRPFSYVAGEDLRLRLDRLEKELAELEGALGSGGPPEAWRILGEARHVAGDPTRAEEALLRGGGSAGRIALERALAARLWGVAATRDVEAAREHLRTEGGDLSAAWLALLEGRDVLRLCDEGFRRHERELGAEEFLFVRAWAESGEARVRSCRLVLRRRPHHAWALILLAAETASLADLDRAIRLAPRIPEAHLLRARLTGSAEDARRARELAPREWALRR